MHTKNWIQGHASITPERLQQSERKRPESLQKTCWLIGQLAWSRGRAAPEMRYRKGSCAGCVGVVAHALTLADRRQGPAVSTGHQESNFSYEYWAPKSSSHILYLLICIYMTYIYIYTHIYTYIWHTHIYICLKLFKKAKMTLNSWSTCFYLLSVGSKGLCHQAWLATIVLLLFVLFETGHLYVVLAVLELPM